MNTTLTPIKSDEDRIADKIDGLVRTLYYKNQPGVVDQLCLLKAKLFATKKLADKERKITVLAVEKEVSDLQMSVI